MHHNGRACASCRPVLIEKEIAQLKKMEDGEEVGVYPPRTKKAIWTLDTVGACCA